MVQTVSNEKNKFIYLFIYLFISLSLGSLLWVGLHLDVEKNISVRERRLLAKFPHPFILKSSLLENYISDHIPFRDHLIDFYFKSKLGIDFGTNKQIIAKENFVFRSKNGYLYHLNPLKAYQNQITEFLRCF